MRFDDGRYPNPKRVERELNRACEIAENSLGLLAFIAIISMMAYAIAGVI